MGALAPKPAINMYPTIKLYDGFAHTTPQYKDEVMLLEQQLRKLGYQVPTNGEFGPTVQQAVMHFQQSKGILATGVVDNTTWNLLVGRAPAQAVAPTPTPARPTPVPAPQGAGQRYIFQTTYNRQDADFLKQLQALQTYAPSVRTIAARYGIQGSVIAGMGSRESRWGLALTPPGPSGTGDHGHGRGLLQIDDRWHPDFINSGQWADASENLRYGAALLRNFIDTFIKKYNWAPGQQTLRAAIAGYNCGPRRVYEAWQAGQDFDFNTAGRNYSADVLSRAGWFQLYGWD